MSHHVNPLCVNCGMRPANLETHICKDENVVKFHTRNLGAEWKAFLESNEGRFEQHYAQHRLRRAV